MSLPAPGDNADVAAEVGGDLHRSLNRFMEHAVREWRVALANVEQQQQGYAPSGQRDDLAGLREFTRSAIDAFERMGREGVGSTDHLTPAEFDWHLLSAAWTSDEAGGGALWERVKQAARDELAVGKTGATAVEGYQARPFERAAYLAVWAALADGLRPRNGMERLLIDGMAEAWVMHLRWLTRHAQTDSLESYRIERDARQRGEWQPPRMSDAEAVDRAALMADRFQRQFLRLMRAYRDQRRLLGQVVVAAGGQLNVGERQINIDRHGPQLIGRARSRPIRRAPQARVRKPLDESYNPGP